LYIQLIDYSNVPVDFIQTIDKKKQVEEISAKYLPETKQLHKTKLNSETDNNIYKIVNQLEIDSPNSENQKRIPDGILYINGLPLVVFEFKSAIREDEATIHDAYKQITIRYRRDIPQLFVFNALCIISDGVNNKMGSLFAPYDFYYAWRKIIGNESVEKDGINSLHTMLQGLFDKARLRDVIRHFIFFPDKSNDEVKIVCRYPQYYASKKTL